MNYARLLKKYGSSYGRGGQPTPHAHSWIRQCRPEESVSLFIIL